MDVLPITEKNIATASKVLRRGGVIIYPTDTAYALGGIFNIPAVPRRILEIKQRRDQKFTLIAADMRQVEKFFTLTKIQRKIGQKFWPGPLSLVVSSRFAVRIPAHPLARRLARAAGAPLIATSANISGYVTRYSSKKIISDFKTKKNQPKVLLNAGSLRRRKTSTIVQAVDSEIKIIRPGAVSVQLLRRAKSK